MGIWEGNKGRNKTNKRKDQIEREKNSGRLNRREVKKLKRKATELMENSIEWVGEKEEDRE